MASIARISDIKGLVTQGENSEEILKNRDLITENGGLLTIHEFAKIIFDDGRVIEIDGPATFTLDQSFFAEGSFEDSVTQLIDPSSLEFIDSQLNINEALGTNENFATQNDAQGNVNSEQLETQRINEEQTRDNQPPLENQTSEINTQLQEETQPTSGQTSSDTANVNPANTDTNEVLTVSVTAESAEFREDLTSADAKVATISANDPDGGDITYTLSDTVNYKIVGNEVQLTQAGALKVNNGEDLPDFTVTAQSTSGQTSSDTANVNPANTDTNEVLTLSVTAESAEFREDLTSADAKVATISANDPDGGDITYTLSDTVNYKIVGNEVQLTQAGALKVNNGEDLPDFTVTAQSTSGQTSSDTANVNPANTDTNEVLTLSVTAESAEFREDLTSADAKVATISANDPDGGDITYTLSDTVNYKIVGNEVQLTQAGALKVNNGEDLPDFTVTAQSTSGQTSSDTANVNPANTDTNEVLTLSVTAEFAEFREDLTSADAKVATISANDPDGGDITYTLSDTVNYKIVGNEVQLTQAGALKVNNGEDLPDFTVTAQSTSGQTSSDTANVNPANTDTNEVLTLSVTAESAEFREDLTSADAKVATISANDPDGGDITYTLSDTVNYKIVDNEVQLTQAGALKVNNGEDLPDFTVTAQSTSGQTSSDTANVNPANTDTNEAPTIEPITTQTVNEDSIISGQIIANDTDGDNLTFSISEKANVPTGLTLKSDGSYTFDANSYDSLNSGETQIIKVPITVSDGKGGITETTLTIDVKGENNDLSYVSEAAGYRNAVGYYEIDGNGNPIDSAKILIDDQNGMQGGTHLTDLSNSSKYGFFIIADGANLVDTNSTITFDMTGDKPILLIDGNTSSKPVYYDNPQFNIDEKDHFRMEYNENGGTTIKIEDLPNLGDADFQDVILHSDIRINDIPSEPVITKALDGDTIVGTVGENVNSIKIIIKDGEGNIISEHQGSVNGNNWSADFDKPSIDSYTMTAIAINEAGESLESNIVNINVGSTYEKITDTDSNINIVYDGAGSNSVKTGAGDDLFVVNRGNDAIDGGEGNDTFIVEGTDKGYNSFQGGEGSDTILGGAGNDNINLSNFGTNNSVEVIDGGEGSNVIQGGTYNNLDFSNTELKNIDEIRDGAGSNRITGNDQDNTFRVNRGNDAIDGGEGNDTFIVEGTDKGYNSFQGGEGSDTILGGAGNDNINLSNFGTNNSVEVIDGGEGSNVIQGGTYNNLDFSNTELKNIDEIRDGAGSNRITGNDQDNTFRVNRGNDAIDGGEGNDTFIVEGTDKGYNSFQGGEGSDTILGGAGNDNINLSNFGTNNSVEVIDGGEGSNVIQGGTYNNLDFSNTELKNIDEIRDGAGSNRITGNDQDNTFRVNRGNDAIDGGEGNDTFIVEGTDKGYNSFQGGKGSDTILGGAGNDNINLSNFGTNNSVEVIDGGEGSNVIQGGTYNNLDFSNTELKNIDEIRDGAGSNRITGNDQDNTFRVNRGNDAIDGGEGNDTFIVEGTDKGYNSFQGGEGSDTILGGAGNDNINLSNFGTNNSVEVIDGGEGSNVIQGGTYNNLDFSNTELKNIDEIRDGAGSNRITGNDQDNTFRVNRGNDAIDGGEGNDTFIVEGTDKGYNSFQGGKGSDTILGGAGNDNINLSNFGTNNSVEVIDGGEGSNVIQGGTYNNLDFSNTELKNIDEIRAGAGSNTVKGSANDDIIDGNRGTDTYIVEGNFNEYTIQSNENGSITITDNIEGRGGSDTLINFENFKFADETISESNLILEANRAPNILLEESFENLRSVYGWHVETGDVTGDHGVVWDTKTNGLEVEKGIVSDSSDGNVHAELDAHHNVTISTQVPLNDSGQYTVSLAMKPRGGAEDSSDMRITFDNISININSDANGNLTYQSSDDSITIRSELNTSNGWNNIVIEYPLVTQDNSTLTIEGTGKDDSYGALIDDIKIIDKINENNDIPKVEVSEVPTINIGQLVDGIVQGAYYETSSGLSGYTDENGNFSFRDGDSITFSVGGVTLGVATAQDVASGKTFLQDIADVNRADLNDEYLENMAVFLQSIDTQDSGDNIVITQQMHEKLENANIDLRTASEEEVQNLVESVGGTYVDENDAMQHVQEMLQEYTNMQEDDFDQRVEDTNSATLGKEPLAGMEYTTSSGISGITDENGVFQYNADDSITFSKDGEPISTINSSDIGDDNLITLNEIKTLDLNNPEQENIPELNLDSISNIAQEEQNQSEQDETDLDKLEIADMLNQDQDEDSISNLLGENTPTSSSTDSSTQDSQTTSENEIDPFAKLDESSSQLIGNIENHDGGFDDSDI